MAEPAIEDVLRLAELAGIDIDPAYRASVRHNLAVLLEQAAKLTGPTIAPQVEPAPVFRP